MQQDGPDSAAVLNYFSAHCPPDVFPSKAADADNCWEAMCDLGWCRVKPVGQAEEVSSDDEDINVAPPSRASPTRPPPHSLPPLVDLMSDSEESCASSDGMRMELHMSTLTETATDKETGSQIDVLVGDSNKDATVDMAGTIQERLKFAGKSLSIVEHPPKMETGARIKLRVSITHGQKATTESLQAWAHEQKVTILFSYFLLMYTDVRHVSLQGGSFNVKYDYRRRTRVEKVSLLALLECLKNGRFMLIDAPVAVPHASHRLASQLMEATVRVCVW